MLGKLNLASLAGLLVAIPAAGANDLLHLNDDFSSDSSASWQRRHVIEGGEDQLDRWAINPIDAAGQMVMVPHTTTWYQPYRGPLVFKEVDGDFAMTTSVTVSNRAGTGTPSADYSLAGLMLRVPAPGAATPDNYVFLSIGHGIGGAPQFEVKTTIEGTSNLVLSAAGSLTTQLQLARVGDKVITLYRRPTDPEWVVHRVYDSDSPNPFFDHNLGTGMVQAGLVTYTNWEKASTFTPEYHNANALTNADNAQSNNPALSFNPDLFAAFDYTYFARVNVPGGFADDATDADYLAILGQNAVPEPSAVGAGCLAAGLLLRRRREPIQVFVDARQPLD